jgi:hypothetical protein
MGFITIPGLLGPLIGPTMGGWMVQYLSWHWIFLINLPVGMIGCWAVWHFIPDLRGSERTRFDGLGFLLFGAAMVFITIAMEGLGELHLPHLRVMLLLFAGMACLAAYWLRAGQYRQPAVLPGAVQDQDLCRGHPRQPVRAPGQRRPAVSGAVAAAGRAGLFAVAGRDEHAATGRRRDAGQMGRKAADRTPGLSHVLTASTPSLLGMMLASMGLVTEQTPYPLLLSMLAVLGAINSLQFTAMNTVTLIDLDDASASSGNSLLSVVAQLSLSLGVACAGALLGGFTGDGGGDGVRHRAGAFQLTFLTVGIMAMLAAAIFLQLSPQDGVNPRPTRSMSWNTKLH